MTTEGASPVQYLKALSEIMSSLRLKDVLEATVVQYAQLTQSNKVAVFLVDNQDKIFRLMAARGYSELSMQNMKMLSFAEDGIFAEIFKSRGPVVLNSDSQLAGFNKGIFERERSINQAAFPLLVGDLFIGAIMVDSNVPILLNEKENWQLTNILTALSIANAIIFGRSEYERERLNTLYKILAAFQNSALNLNQILQKTADAALVLGNTPYCAVLLWDHDNNSFALSAFKGFDGTSLPDFDLSSPQSLAARALKRGERLFLDKAGLESEGMPKAMGGGLFRCALAIPLINEGSPIGVLEVFSTDEDAFNTEQAELLEVLSSQASKAIQVAQQHESTLAQVLLDPHTGLLNRAHFQSALEIELERSIRHKHSFSLLFLDIDYLSHVNDRWGEETGDETIAEVAKVVKKTLREIDLIYRFGGDQFAIILPETMSKDVPVVVDRLREKINSLVIPNAGSLTISIGAATYPNQSEDAEELTRLSEYALYLAKYQGRNRLVEAPTAQVRIESNAWLELAKYAKEAVSAERRERAKSHLSSSADYANWLLKVRDNSVKSGVNKDQVPLP